MKITAWDILLVFLTGGLWCFVIAYKLHKGKKIYQQQANYEMQRMLADQAARQNLEAKYGPYVEEHYKNLEEIGVRYSVLNNARVYFGTQVDELINICSRDVSIAPVLKNYWLEMYAESNLPNYESFKRLAIIYEKRKEFNKAVEVCKTAIQLGFIEDGTDGKMYGRLAKLLRLSGNEHAIEEYLASK